MGAKRALSLQILSECSTTKARTCKMTLPHGEVATPVFMPVGTQGSLKGMTVEQLEESSCQIMLGNTYHLGSTPVIKQLKLIITQTNDCIENDRKYVICTGVGKLIWQKEILSGLQSICQSIV